MLKGKKIYQRKIWNKQMDYFFLRKKCSNKIFFKKFICRADPDGWTLCDAGHTGRAESHDAALYQKVEHGHLATSNNPYLRNPTVHRPYPPSGLPAVITLITSGQAAAILIISGQAAATLIQGVVTLIINGQAAATHIQAAVALI